MRERLIVERVLRAEAEAVWRLLAAGDRVERWFEWVDRTEVHDAGEGGSRTIHMKDGTSFDEQITVCDRASRTYQYYAPHPPLPIAHVIGTKRITSGHDGAAVLTWAVSFDHEADAPADIGVTMRRLYEDALGKIDAAALALRGS